MLILATREPEGIVLVALYKRKLWEQVIHRALERLGEGQKALLRQFFDIPPARPVFGKNCDGGITQKTVPKQSCKRFSITGSG